MDKIKCKIRIIKEIEDLYPQYMPKVGKIYNALYVDSTRPNARQRVPPVCVVDIAGKRIIVRENEFEIVEG